MQVRIDGRPATAGDLLQLLRWPDKNRSQRIEIVAAPREIESFVKTGCFALQHRGVLQPFQQQHGSEQPLCRELCEYEYEEIPIDAAFPGEGCETVTIAYIAHDKPEQLLVLRKPGC